MKEIVFVRHGKVVGLEEKRIYGNTDIALNQEGIEKTLRAGLVLCDEQFDRIYCSPLMRAKNSLENIRIAGVNWPETIFDDRLKELNFGDVEMKTHQEVSEQLPETFRSMNMDYLSTVFPNGESILHLYARVSNFLHECVLSQPNARVLIVAHSGVIRSALCSLLKMGASHYWDFYVDFGGIVRVTVEGDHNHAMIQALNENK